jgi:hypothetical protein
MCDHGRRLTTMVNTVHGPRISSAFDGWFRYPAGFSVSTLERCADVVRQCGPVGAVGDPFAGVATVGRRCIEEGWAFRGIEAHPLIARIAELKFKRPGPPEELAVAARKVVDAARPGDIAGEHDLVRRTFTDATLVSLVGLRDAIAVTESRWQAHLELALLSVLRDHANVKVGWPYQLPAKPRQPRSTDPKRRFLERAERFASDLAVGGDPDAQVVCGDSREARPWKALGTGLLDAVITSPPYLNNFDYADATRLELYFLGEVSTWRELCEQVRAGMVVASTQQSHKAPAEAALESLADLAQVHARVAPLVDQLDEQRRHKERRWGKQYNWLVSLYFRDLRRVLEHLRANVRADGRVAVVIGDSAPYGIYIDTPGLLTLMAEELGFTPVASSELRSRGARWRTNGTRHQVPLCERLVVWQAPGPATADGGRAGS